MVTQTLNIPGRLPGLNDIIAASRIAKGKWSKYNDLKAKWGADIGLLARAQGFKPIISGHFLYLFYEPNRLRDPSNILSGATKLIEDALQVAGLLKNDGWDNVLSITHYLAVHAEPSVQLIVTVEEWAK